MSSQPDPWSWKNGSVLSARRIDGGLERTVSVSKEKLIALASQCGGIGEKEGGGEIQLLECSE